MPYGAKKSIVQLPSAGFENELPAAPLGRLLLLQQLDLELEDLYKGMIRYDVCWVCQAAALVNTNEGKNSQDI